MMGLPNGCCPDDRQDAEGGSRGRGRGGCAVTDHKGKAVEIVKGALVTLVLLALLGVAGLFLGAPGDGVARVENRHVRRATELYVDARSQSHAVVQETEDSGEFVPFFDLTEIRLGQAPMPVCESIESPPQVTPSGTWQTIFGQVAGAGVLGALILLAYLFVDAGAHGRYTWPLRIGTAAAFVAVCILLWQIGLSG